MPTPPSVTFKTVHGQILALNSSGTPATGSVRFESLTAARDIVDNIVFGPTAITAALDSNGEFTVSLAATNDSDLDPSGWMWRATVETNVLRAVYYLSVDAAGPVPIEFADVVTTTAPPGFNTYSAAEVDTLLALKVAKAGDTVTGDLVLSGGTTDLNVGGDLTVSGSSTMTYLGITGDVMRLLSTAVSTGVVSGGELNPNADPTKLDISAMTGWIVEYNSGAAPSATNPQITFVSLSAQVGLVLTGPLSQIVTWWLVDSSATIVQQATEPTPTQRRTHLVLGATAQFGGTIFANQTIPVIQSQPANQLADLMDALGTFSKSGNVLSANGANLSFDKSAGTMFARAFSHVPLCLDPHNADLPAQTPVSGRRATATDTLPTLETLLDVGNYDPSGLGVVTAVPGGANVSTNFRVWAFAVNATTDQLIVQYGQGTYTSLAGAVAGIGSGTYIRNPLFTGGALLGWISAIHTATDLSDPAQAVFTQAPKFATP